MSFLRKRRLFLMAVMLFFLIGFTREYHWPKLKTWILVNVEELSRHHLPVRILAQDLEVRLWPPTISLKNVQALPQGTLRQSLGPIKMAEIAILPLDFQILEPRFQLIQLRLVRPEVNVIIKDSGGDSDPGPSFQPFDALQELPLQSIAIEQMKLHAQVGHENLATRMNDLNLRLDVKSTQASLSLQTSEITVKRLGQSPQVSLSVDSQWLLEKDQIEIVKFEVKKGESTTTTSGVITGDFSKQRLDQASLQTDGFLDLPVLRRWVTETFPKVELPATDGLVNFQLGFQKKGMLQPSWKFHLTTEGLKVDRYFLGSTKFKGQIEKNRVKASHLSINNSSGNISLNGLEISMDDQREFSAELQLDKVSLPKFLPHIGVNGVPVELLIQTQIPCRGRLSLPVDISCQGTVVGHDLKVNTDDTVLVSIDRFTADGRLQVDGEKVTYDAQLSMAKDGRKKILSRGKSRGTINYEKGFNISFESPSLHLEDIGSIAGLKLRGTTAIRGVTRGDSSYGVVDADIQPKNFYFEDFFLGEFQTQFRYRQQKLGFTEVRGKIGNSRYLGQLDVDLRKSQLSTRFDFEYFDGRDLQGVLKNRIPLPFQLTGIGTAQFNVWGPLQLHLLSYDSYFQLSKGSLARESFESLVVDVSSRDGFSKVNKAEMIKGRSLLSVTGQGKPDGNIQGQMIARKFRMEDSELALSLGLKMKGSLNFNVNVDGHYLQPFTRIDGILSGVRIAETTMEPSSFELTVDPSHIAGQGKLFGEKIAGNFRWPFRLNEPFYIDLQVNNWDFVPLFGVLNDSIDSLGYQSNSRGQIQLRSNTGGFWASSGRVVIDEFQLSRGDQELRAREPLRVIFNDGVIRSEDFELYGVNSYVKTLLRPSTANRLDGNISAKFDLSLLAFLTPFFEDLRGRSSFSFNLGGHQKNIELFGSAFVEEGYVKFKDFPHAFEQINGDFSMSQSKLLINSLTSSLANGDVSANGSITFKDIGDTPTEVSISARGLDVRFPEGVRSQLSGQGKIQGSWFPLTIRGDVEVSGGEITRDFDSFSSQGGAAGANPFLPQLLSESDNSPFLVDLQVTIPSPFRVKNSLVEAAFSGDLQAEGDPLSPRLSGKVNSLPDAVLKVQKWPFELEEAFLQFRSLQPMDPLIYAKASGRKDDHDIQFFVQGPLSQAQEDIQLTSTPEKTKEEIVQILAFGAGDTDSQAFGQVGQFLGDFLIPPDLKEKFDLGIVYEQDQETEDNPVDRVGFRGSLGKDLQVTFTGDAGTVQSPEVKAEYQVNRKLSIIGSWEDSSRENSDGAVDADSEGDSLLGIDIEFRHSFE